MHVDFLQGNETVTHSGLSSSVYTCNLSVFSFALLPKLFVLFEPVVAI